MPAKDLFPSVPAEIQSIVDQQQLSPAVTASQQSQLSVSVNQLYSGLWSLQRKVGLQSERMTALEAGANRDRDSLPSPRDDNTEPKPNNVVEPLQPRILIITSHHIHHENSGTACKHLRDSTILFTLAWECFLQTFSETNSGVSSGALNNQV